MPISFSIDPAAGTLYSVATGIVSYDDVVNHLDAKAKSKALSYAELFDAREVTLNLSISDLQRIAQRVRTMMGRQTPARVAVVTRNNFVRGLARTYAALTVQEHSAFDVFSDLEEARAWVLEASPESA